MMLSKIAKDLIGSVARVKAAFIKDNLFIACVDNLAKSDFEQLKLC